MFDYDLVIRGVLDDQRRRNVKNTSCLISKYFAASHYFWMDLESLQLELDQTKNQLMMAAQFGAELVEKNQSLESNNAILDQEVLQLKTELRDHAQSVVSQQKDLDNKYNTVNHKYRAAMDEIKLLTETNQGLLEEIEKKDKLIIKYRGIDKELIEYREELEKLVANKETMENQIEQLEDEKIEMKREISSISVTLKKANESYDALQLENSDLVMQNKQKGSAEKAKASQLLSRIQDMEKTMEELDKTHSDTKYEKIQLEKMVADFAIQNEELTREREENFLFLEQTKARLADFTKEEVENICDSREEDFSLLGELQLELETRIGKEDPSSKATLPIDAPENCREFFFLAATAVKIAFAIQSPTTSDGCFQINIQALYQQAIDQAVPFHDWYDWIKLQLASKQQSLRVSVTSSASHDVNKVQPMRRKVVKKAPPPPKKSWYNILG